jgi:succinate dehydrogenase/fumarate reductase flavoprotein subunit
MDTTYDVLIVGAGNAALCAAIVACERGASLGLRESPRVFPGRQYPLTGGSSAPTMAWTISALIPI